MIGPVLCTVFPCEAHSLNQFGSEKVFSPAAHLAKRKATKREETSKHGKSATGWHLPLSWRFSPVVFGGNDPHFFLQFLNQHSIR
jgi:hypothetical protein